MDVAWVGVRLGLFHRICLHFNKLLGSYNSNAFISAVEPVGTQIEYSIYLEKR